MSTKQADTGEVKLEKVTLIAKHTHAGLQYEANDQIEVNAVEKAWLIRHGRVAAPAEQAPAANKAKE